jgi:hypothetical protein
MVPLWFQIVVFLPTGACADPCSANYSRSRAGRPRWKDCDALRTIRGKAAENCGFAPRRLIAAIGNDFL